MTYTKSFFRLASWSTAAALVYGCTSATPDDTGTGGSGGTGTGHGGSGGTSSAGKAGSTGGAGTSSTSGSGGTLGSSGTGAGTGPAGSGGAAGTNTSGAGGATGGAGASSSGAGGRMGSGGAGAGAGGRSGGAGGAGAGMAGSGPTAGASGAAGAAGAAGASGAGGGSGTGKSAGCGKAPTIASSMYNNGQHISITVGSMQRRYILNVPTNYDNTKPYKLIIAYHELNGNDDEMYKNKYYHLLPLSNDSAIFVAPNGQQNNASCTQASGCGWPNPNNSDLALADAVVAQIEENFCVDTNRIFATGWSYGGSMSYKTACERPLGGVANGFVRAIAVYSGSQLSGNCTPTKPVAYFASHGTHDSVLQYSNGVGLAQNFAKANGCTWATPTSVSSGAHVCTNEMGCTAGYPVEFCSFNGDHTPDPDNGQSGSSWVYQPVWDFFNQF